MVEIEKHIWLLVLIGGIITIIALITPAAIYISRSPSLESEFYLWMINLYYSHRYEFDIHTISVEFDTHLISLVPSIFCSIIIAISSIIIIITANKYRKGVLGTRISWLVSAIGTIIASVIWMIMMEVSRRVLFGHGFWSILSPSFGIIGPYIGASLEIIGFLLSKKKLRNT